MKTLFKILICFFFVGFLNLGFISCSPNLNQSESVDPDASNNQGSTDEVENEGELCSNSPNCKTECEYIYSEYSAQRECMSRGDITVAKMGTVYDLITPVGKDVSVLQTDLKYVSEGKGGIDTGDFKNYVHIPNTKWIQEIRSHTDTAKIILEWLAENDTASEALSSASGGKLILKSIIESHTCRSACSSGVCSSITVDSPRGPLMGITVASSATQGIANIDIVGGSPISLRIIENINLYKALSCHFLGENGQYNIFSYSTEEANNESDNDTLFSMAFALLEDACNRDDNLYRKSKSVLCKKYFTCWIGYKNTIGVYDTAKIAESDVLRMFSDYSSELQYKKIGYDKCSLQDFTRIVTDSGLD